MIQNKVFNTCLAGVLTAGFASGFVGFPVFADGPVNISIVELINDGSGELKPWVDIVGAMPGETYSAIPRINNIGSSAANIKVCLSESAINSNGEVITLPNNTFGIEINNNWFLDDTESSDVSDPASGNCYNYNSVLNIDGLTEPVFSEVTLSPTLKNEYQGATFSLHIDAYAEAKEVSPDEPDKPDTGVVTNNEKLSNAFISIPYFLGGAALVVLLIHIIRSIVTRKK